MAGTYELHPDLVTLNTPFSQTSFPLFSALSSRVLGSSLLPTSTL